MTKCAAEIVWALRHICNLDDGHKFGHECGGCSATWDDEGNTSGLDIVSAYPAELIDVNTLYPYRWRERAEFDALLVGEPTTGGLIRHRARRVGLLRRILRRLWTRP